MRWASTPQGLRMRWELVPNLVVREEELIADLYER